MRFERREFPDCRPGTGGIVHRGSRKLIQQRADSLGHFRPRSPLDGASVIKCCYAATGMYMTAAAAILRE